MRTVTVNVSPKLATEWMDRHFELNNVKQRHTYNMKVLQYASDMKGERWELNHQSLGITKRGAVVDGIHRLTAVVMAHKTVPMRVTFGAPERSIDTIDCGRPRSVEVILRMSHGINDARVLTSASRVMLTIGNGMLTNSISPVQALEIIKIVGRDIQIIVDALGLKRPSSYLVGPISFYHTAKPRKAEEFAESYNELANLPKHHPVIHLKKYFESKRESFHEVFNLSQATCSALRRFDEGKNVPDLLERGPEQWEWMVKQNEELMEKIQSITK